MNYPLIHYFKSKHCAPCKPVEKMLDEINISLFGNRLNIKKVDIAEDLELARKFNVLSVPTIVIGKVRLSVVIDKNELTDAILQGFLSSVSFEEEPIMQNCEKKPADGPTSAGSKEPSISNEAKITEKPLENLPNAEKSEKKESS
jgi:thioredoxin 1